MPLILELDARLQRLMQDDYDQADWKFGERATDSWLAQYALDRATLRPGPRGGVK